MPPALNKLTSVLGVQLAGSPGVWDIKINYPDINSHGITSITPHDPHDSSDPSSPPPPALALPSLVHPHIHLDKAFLHSEPKYAHLFPASGTFHEALSFTAAAKENFTLSDLLKRGEWLLAESVSSGVTAMRAFVEVDHTVNLTCVEAAIMLQKQWSGVCEMQIVCFAQDPIFSTEYADENRNLVEQALATCPQIEVIGTTPYVESSIEAAKQNIEWAIIRALQLDKHLDFHLDYNLDEGKEALVWHVLHTLIQRGWTTQSTRKRIMLGHCTRLTLFTKEDWQQIARLIHTNNLPVSFVGLPTSDLYMASSPGQLDTQHRARGTLRVPELIQQYGLDAVIGVNNVGNAFTPWGTADPLFLACLCVGVYQTGTRADAELLYECVSTRARAAIGLGPTVKDQGPGRTRSLMVQEGSCLDVVLFCDRDATGCGVSRPRRTAAEVVWDPPSRLCRDVVFRGGLKAGMAGLDARYSFSCGD